MPLDQIKPWVLHLLKRQDRKVAGENIEIFAFYPEEKRVKLSAKGKKRARLDAFDSDTDDEDQEVEIERALDIEDTEPDTERAEDPPQRRKSKVRLPAGKVQERPVIPGWDDEEADEEVEDEGSGYDPGPSLDDFDETISDPEDGSPASISTEWDDRVKYLYSLSQEKDYIEIVKHLDSVQVPFVCICIFV